MISYAQNFEDVILSRVFGNVSDGFYVDVGAWDPVIDSVTKHFYDAGWHGINVEPNPAYFLKLQQVRDRDVNLNCAISNCAEKRKFFLFEDTGVSTLSADLAEYFKTQYIPGEIEIETQTLNEVLSDISNEISFLKVDAEGWELQVISSCDWSKYRPIVIVTEALDPRTNLQNCDNWHSLLAGNGYDFVYFDGLNRFYLRRESIELRSAFDLPPNIFDNFVSREQHELAMRLQGMLSQLSRAELLLSQLNRYLGGVIGTADGLPSDDIDGSKEQDSDTTITNAAEGVGLDAKLRRLDTLVRRTAALVETSDSDPRTGQIIEELRTEAAKARIWAGEVAQARAKQVLRGMVDKR